MISTSGATLLPNSAINTLITHLLPQTTLLTPNIPEATLILQQSGHTTSEKVSSADDLEALARGIQNLGPKWVLVKGGHCPFVQKGKKVVVDVLVGPEGCWRVESEWQDSESTHGTGCSLACKLTLPLFSATVEGGVREERVIGADNVTAAIASNLAKGIDMPTAVRAACRYIEAGIRTAPGLGSGHGPLNHFHSTYTLPFSP